MTKKKEYIKPEQPAGRRPRSYDLSTRVKTKMAVSFLRMVSAPAPELSCGFIDVAALARELSAPTFSKPHQSALIEMVDKVIDFFTEFDEADGATTPGLDDLITARGLYNGPGIHAVA